MKCKIKKEWIDAELEHTTSRKMARKIVGDHIREYGCGYYPELKKIQNKLKRR